MNLFFRNICLGIFLSVQMFAEPVLYLKPRFVTQGNVVKLGDIAKLPPDVKNIVVEEQIDEVKAYDAAMVRELLASQYAEISQIPKVLGKECVVIPLNTIQEKETIRTSLEQEF
jgi:hypothetical protein